MKAPESLKLKINEMLDNHWEDICRDNSFQEILYDEGYFYPIKISLFSEGKYITIKILPKISMGVTLT